MAFHQAVWYRLIHQCSGSLQLVFREVGAFGQEISHPLVMDLSGPAGGKQSGRSQSNQKIAQWRRVENAGVDGKGMPSSRESSSSRNSGFWGTRMPSKLERLAGPGQPLAAEPPKRWRKSWKTFRSEYE